MANKLIKEYIVKGFNLNDDRFIKENKFDKKYFEELLERIRTIRVSERMSYQKITDLFIETSTGYNKRSNEAYTFLKLFKIKCIIQLLVILLLNLFMKEWIRRKFI